MIPPPFAVNNLDVDLDFRLPRTNIVIPGLSDGLEKPPTIWGSCTDPSNLLPTTHPSEPLVITLIPQLRLRLLKSIYFCHTLYLLS